VTGEIMILKGGKRGGRCKVQQTQLFTHLTTTTTVFLGGLGQPPPPPPSHRGRPNRRSYSPRVGGRSEAFRSCSLLSPAHGLPFHTGGGPALGSDRTADFEGAGSQGFAGLRSRRAYSCRIRGGEAGGGGGFAGVGVGVGGVLVGGDCRITDKPTKPRSVR